MVDIDKLTTTLQSLYRNRAELQRQLIANDGAIAIIEHLIADANEEVEDGNADE